MYVNLSVKNVPNEIARQLRARAKRNHRSLQGELLAILEDAAALPLTVEEAYDRIKGTGLKTPDESTRLIRRWRDSRYGEPQA